MRSRRIAVIGFAVVLAAFAASIGLPGIVRRVAIAQLGAVTGRPAAIDAVELDVWRGRLVAHGIHLAERDGSPFADLERLEVRLSLLALLRGQVWIRDLGLHRLVVRLVRRPTGELNLLDLIGREGGRGRPVDLAIDRFSLHAGQISLEDRALPGAPTWTSEDIAVEASNVSTRSANGRASASSLTGGARVSVNVTRLRLHPIELEATVTTDGMDLAPISVYLPPGTPVVVDRGRARTEIWLALDARGGLRVDVSGHLVDLALVRTAGREVVAVAPDLRVDARGVSLRDGAVHLGRVELSGTVGVADPRFRSGAMQMSTVRAGAWDLSWPPTTDGRVDLRASLAPSGSLTVAGTVRPPPAPSQLHARLVDLDVAPWASVLSLPASVAGIVAADLRLDEPLAAEVPARVHGSIAVDRLAVSDAGRELVHVRRVEASGLEVGWPARIAVGRLSITGPRALVERDRTGAFPLRALMGGAISAASASSVAAPARRAVAQAGEAPPPRLMIGQVVLRDGGLSWRDESVAPPARLQVSGIDAEVSGIGWPVAGPLGVRISLRAPAGGRVHAKGQVRLDPPGADLRVVAEGVALTPYQAYLPMTARLGGTAGADVSVEAPAPGGGRVKVRGTAALSHLDVRDGSRTVARVERAAATGLDVEWPERLAVTRVALTAPWILVERDERGALGLHDVARRGRRPAGAPGPQAPGEVETARPEPGGEERVERVLRIERLTVEEGGARLVDRSVSPPFGADVQDVALDVEGLATAPARPARLHLTGRVGATTELSVRGTVGTIGAPLKLDVNAELRRFGMPRANPYVQRHVAWQVRDGWLTTKVRARVDGDLVSARTDLSLSRVEVVRAGAGDEAQTRIGLPLGLILALMKDSRGDIALSFPVSGRLGDPRFDYREAIWGALRTVAVNAITLPVSWIGRVRMSPDARIQRIEVDPVSFAPGTADMTAEGQAQAAKLAAFLRELTEIRMTLTPAVVPADRAALGRDAVGPEIERVARDGGLPRGAAAARLFQQRFPGRATPSGPASIEAALAEAAPAAARELPALAARRAAALRAALERQGIDGSRLADAPLVERAGSRGQVEIDVREPAPPRRSPVRDFFRRLPAPLTRP